MADDLADEVKVFRRNDTEDQDTTAQSSLQLAEDKKDVALETELEARPVPSENLLGAKAGIFKPTALASPSFGMGMMPPFSPSYLHPMFAMPWLMSNQAATAAAYGQAAVRMSPSFMGFMPAALSPSFGNMQLYNNFHMLASPGSPLHAHMTGKVGQVPLPANMRTGNPLNQMNNMRLPYNPMASMANTMTQATTPKRSMEDRRRPHIKKPLNAFMWYMKENRPKLMEELNYKEKQSAELNKELGRRWHSLDKEGQQPYFEMAKKDREQHKERYPHWSARENYAIHKKKKRKREKSEEMGDQKKCRAKFGINRQDQWCKFCKRKKKCIYSSNPERSTSSEPSLSELGLKMELDEGAHIFPNVSASDSESDVDEMDGEEELDDPTLTQQALNEVAQMQDAI